MNSVSVTKLCVVLLVLASWVADAYHCPVASSHCSAHVAMKIRVNGVGSCKGAAKANCGAFAAATRPCVDKFVKDIKSKKCKPLHLSGAAKCTAKALAIAYADAYTAVKCSGKAWGCGYAHSQSNAFACTFAAALVKIAVQSGGNKAKCYQEASAMVGVYAAAAAEARAFVCARNGHRSDYEREFSVRIEQAIAKAYAACWTKCNGVTASAGGGGGASASLSPSFQVGNGPSGGGDLPLPDDFDPFGHK